MGWQTRDRAAATVSRPRGGPRALMPRLFSADRPAASSSARHLVVAAVAAAQALRYSAQRSGALHGDAALAGVSSQRFPGDPTGYRPLPSRKRPARQLSPPRAAMPSDA